MNNYILADYYEELGFVNKARRLRKLTRKVILSNIKEYKQLTGDGCGYFNIDGHNYNMFVGSCNGYWYGYHNYLLHNHIIIQNSGRGYFYGYNI